MQYNENAPTFTDPRPSTTPGDSSRATGAGTSGTTTPAWEQRQARREGRPLAPQGSTTPCGDNESVRRMQPNRDILRPRPLSLGSHI